MTAGGTTNKSDRVQFNQWVASIKHKNRYATSRDGWLKLEWLHKYAAPKKSNA